MANKELTIELIKDVVVTIVKEEVGSLRSEMNQGFDQILKTIDTHMAETDTKITSDRKRIERLEKIVLY